MVITKNEEHNIDACLKSVQWADEIIVVDAESNDRTIEIARRHTDKIFITPWMGFAAAKQFAVVQSHYDWILWLDADERVLPELSEEIQRIVQLNPNHAAFTVARRAYFLGKWIKHSGWYPGRVARLFHKGRAKFNSAAVHEGLEVKGSTGQLRNDLVHYTDPNIHHYFEKYNRYTTLAAHEAFMKGKSAHLSDLLIRPLWQFLRMYLIRLGFLDGIHGLLLAVFSSSYVFTKYAKLREKKFVQQHVH
ncbi:MAG: glycosyltransferase family 2 protein [Ignavibacteriales bacterium]|nr:glycosyltransferase family 2 protein [Ignavibacteriales bacterium]